MDKSRKCECGGDVRPILVRADMGGNQLTLRYSTDDPDGIGLPRMIGDLSAEVCQKCGKVSFRIENPPTS